MSSYFISSADDALTRLPMIHEPGLVALSLLVAVLSAMGALHAVTLVSGARSPRRAAFMKLASVTALAGGVWVMHFIGMLALDICVSVRYDPLLTALSIVPGFIASAAALQLMTRRALTPGALLCGGMLTGTGIAAMHYLGMEAMQMSARLRFDPWVFALSILIAVSLATAALWATFFVPLRHRPTRLLVSGSIMGLAMAGTHYAGMAAARFTGTPETAPVTDVLTPVLLLSGGFIGLSVFVLGVLALLRYRERVDDLNERSTVAFAHCQHAGRSLPLPDGRALDHAVHERRGRDGDRLFRAGFPRTVATTDIRRHHAPGRCGAQLATRRGLDPRARALRRRVPDTSCRWRVAMDVGTRIGGPRRRR